MNRSLAIVVTCFFIACGSNGGNGGGGPGLLPREAGRRRAAHRPRAVRRRRAVPRGSGTSGYVVFYANTTFTSGTVDLLEIFDYAASHGWMPAATSSTLAQISFGIEICSTNGQDATWTFTNYSVTAN